MSEQFIAGHYRILEKLGSGAFGHTYLAEDTHLPNNQRCVVKQLKPQSTDRFTIETAKRLFPREAKTLLKLGEHPQIPRLLAHLEEENEFYLVQEYIKGHNLDKEIKPGLQLEESQVVKLLDEVLDILTFVHQEKVIHRDIKPSNIMRREKDGKLFLIDFGAVKEIATQISKDKELSRINPTRIGTPGYISSEQSMGHPKFVSDIYALGMMAIFALTGIDPSQLFRDSKTGEIQWRNYAKVNSKLADIVDKMIRYDFQKRYPSAIETRQALKEFLNPPPPINPPPSSDSSEKGVSTIRKNIPQNNGQNYSSETASNHHQKVSSWKTKLAATFLLMSLGGGSYYFWQQNKIPLTLTYENTEYGIEIDYPDNWILEEVDDSFGTVVRFYPEKDRSKNTKVTIDILESYGDTSLDDYNTSAIGKIVKYLPMAKIIDSQPIELADKLAHKIIYTGENKSTNSTNKYLQVWFKEKDRIFIMTYVAPEDEYQDFSKTAEQIMISSFVGEEINK